MSEPSLIRCAWPGNPLAIRYHDEEWGVPQHHDRILFEFLIFVGGKPKVNKWRSLKQLPVRTPESDAMSKDLRKRGFSFVGSTICYAFMQAVGMVNDHARNCFRYAELSRQPALRAR